MEQFNEAERGGVHDFIEIALATMTRNSIAKVNGYLQSGHKQVDANEILTIVTESFQEVLDKIKRNLEQAKTISFICKR